MAKVSPDVAMIPFATAMVWALIRLWGKPGCTLVAGRGRIRRPGAVVEIYRRDVDPGRTGICAGAGLARALAAQPLSLGSGADRGRAVLAVLIWNAGHDWASFRFQFVRATATHGWSLRTVGDFIGLQFGLVGFISFPVVLSALVITASRGYRRRDAVAILLSTCVLLPFCYFFWRSLTLRVGDTWPMFMWPIGFAAAAINIVMLRREAGWGWSNRRCGGRPRRSWTGIAFVVGSLFIMSRPPFNFIGKNDPIGGEAGFEQVVSRAEAELQKTGATWIATTDYRTYAMLRWFFAGRVPVIQINERGRYIGFHDPGMNLIKGHPGLYVGREPDNFSTNPLWAFTTATREPLERVERSWRGIVADTYALEKTDRLDA